MMYWYDTATRLEKLYNYQKEQLDCYYKLTGIQASSVEKLKTVYANKVANEEQLRLETEAEMSKLNSQVKGLKIKNTILTIGVGGLALTTVYFAVFQ